MACTISTGIGQSGVGGLLREITSSVSVINMWEGELVAEEESGWRVKMLLLWTMFVVVANLIKRSFSAEIYPKTNKEGNSHRFNGIIVVVGQWQANNKFH